MGLLYDAAVAWDGMHSTTYDLLLGRAGKLFEPVALNFLPEDFPHLAGMQYANDVDFNISRAERFGEKLVGKIIAKDFDDALIEKAENWDRRIKGRLCSLLALERTLDSEFLIFQFDKRKVKGGSDIDAKYVIKNKTTSFAFFVFLDKKESSRWYCKSIFPYEVADYTAGQTRLTVLKKQKRISGEIRIDYTHKNYIPSKEPVTV